ncbi:hypothetical protein FBEOM_10474 [Fusarium beomiforme]|uniref:SnoaL-like domain-containing protein n=1 Tax=Fusarium beomiforme TaxID=44412 RepID=A0A9P5AC88_9HYPO|nr:hypothetical protein FBEOM_10474 [Fusarium beomiforme]
MENAPPRSLNSSISRILTCLTGFMDGATNAGLDQSPSFIFEQTVTRLASQDAKYYEVFYKLQQNLSRLTSRLQEEDSGDEREKEIEDVERKICDITNESRDFIEIKDVQSELRMIHGVLQDQWSSIRVYADQRRMTIRAITDENQEDLQQQQDILQEEVAELENAVNNIASQLSKVKSLSENASSVEESTPVSFASAFMAIPTQEFPHNSEGEVSWGWWQVFAASHMAVSPEAAAIIQRKKAQYCRFADSNQWDRFDSIMLPNATFLFHNPDGSVITKGDIEYSWSSTKEWVAFFENEFKTMQTIHIIGPAEMEQIAPDEIKAIWAVTYHAGTKEHEGGVHGTGGGHYHETWRKVGDDWFMESLRMERLYWKVLSV